MTILRDDSIALVQEGGSPLRIDGIETGSRKAEAPVGVCNRWTGRLAQRQRVQECPRQESNLALDLRRVACLRHTPRTSQKLGIPRLGVEPGLAASKTAVRPPHSRGVPLPGVEPGPRPSEGRMPSLTLQGHAAGAQGFEPCSSGLEPESSPTRTPLFVENVPDRIRTGAICLTSRHAATYTTDTAEGAGFEPARLIAARVPGGSRLQVGWPFRLQGRIGGTGIEPVTSGMSHRRSGLLS